jgi:hypothetical protein
MLVCEDDALRALDAQHAALVSRAPIAGAVLMESDSAWFARRSRCAFSPDHRACLVAAYNERIALHEVLAAARPPEAKTYVRPCMIREQSRETRFFGAPGYDPTIVLSDATSGEVLGVLFPYVSAAAPWKPFATISLPPMRFGIKIADGTFWRCRREGTRSGAFGPLDPQHRADNDAA